MGNCQAQELESKQISESIDKQIRLDSNAAREKNTIKLLLLGTGEGGKSTIVKQMKIINMGGYSHEERLQFKTIIYLNIYYSAKCLLQALETLGLHLEEENEANIIKFLREFEQLLANDKIFLTPDACNALKNVWADSAANKVTDSSCYLPDSSS